MSQRVFAAGILAAVLLGGCTSASSIGHGQGTTPPAAASRALMACQSAALALGYGPEVPAMTGEHGDFYELINRGASACTLAGYPDVTLQDASGAVLPFRYRHRHSQYVTGAGPVTVTLRPGAAAWVLVAKYRCDIGIGTAAMTIRVTVPGARRAAPARPVSSGGAGVSNLYYCRGGTRDPGQTIGVSPFEPTLQATVRR